MNLIEISDNKLSPNRRVAAIYTALFDWGLIQHPLARRPHDEDMRRAEEAIGIRAS
jgi:hypothetical protein